MSMLRIIHAADLHLDTPFDGLPEEKAAIRRKEQRELLSAIATETVKRGADLVLLPGDLFDSGSIYRETARMLGRVISAMGCPVFISPGNHDYYSDTSPYASIETQGNLHIFKSNKIQCVELDSLGVRVFGAAFTDSICPPLLKGFRAERYPDAINLMCIHGEVGVPGSRYNPISEAELAASGMDYVALGHIHDPSGLKKAGTCSYSMSGCPEGRGFDECGSRFINYVEIDRRTGEVSLQQIPIAIRHCYKLDVDVSNAEPLLAVHSKLPESTERDIYRITLKGECENAPNLKLLYSNLEELFFHLELRDETRMSIDIWEKAGEDSLRGIFLKKLKEKYDSAKTEAERNLAAEAARWGLAVLDRGEVPASDY